MAQTAGFGPFTTPLALLGWLPEPPLPEGTTVRTAGSCGCAGGAATPALSPAILPVGPFRPLNPLKQGCHAGFGGSSPVGVLPASPVPSRDTQSPTGGDSSAVFTTDYPHSRSRSQFLHCVLDSTSAVTWQACRTGPVQRRMKRAAPHGTALLFLSFYSSFMSALVHVVSALVPAEAPSCDPKSFPCELSAWSNRTLAGSAGVPVCCPGIAGSRPSLSAH